MTSKVDNDFEIPNAKIKNLCSTCSHEYEHKYKEEKYKVGDVVVYTSPLEGNDQWICIITRVEGGLIEKVYDLDGGKCGTQFNIPVVRIYLATDEEVRKFLNDYYTQKVGDWLVRSYEQENGKVRLCQVDQNGEEGCCYLVRGEFYRAICTELNIKIMPFDQSKGEYPYPEEMK